MTNMSPENEAHYVEIQLGYLRSLATQAEVIRWCAFIAATASVVYGVWGIRLLKEILRVLEQPA